MFYLLIEIDSSAVVMKETRELSTYIRKTISFMSVDYNHIEDFDSLLSSSTFLPHHCKVRSQERTDGGALKVLLLGDSVDRNMVFDFCNSNPEYNFSTTWANISYYSASHSSGCCTSPQFIFCHAHLFGSAAKGPYMHGWQNNAEDSNVDTELRIPLCIRDYIKRFGDPEFVLFRSELWDSSYLQNVTLPLRNSTADDRRDLSNQFIKNFRNDFELIRQWSPMALIGTHTVPKPRDPSLYFYDLLHAMRYVSEEVSA